VMTEKQVPKAMIGRRLSQEEAKRLLAKFEQANRSSDFKRAEIKPLEVYRLKRGLLLFHRPVVRL
jgi:hypothetical protein